VGVSRGVAILHRTLGTALWILFVSWFASGIVMTFAGFPLISARERLERAPALRGDQVRAAAHAALPPGALAELEITSLGDRAVYRARTAAGSSLVYADTGEPFTALSNAEAAAIASAWLGEPVRVDQRLDDVDQWTPQSQGALPLLRLRAGDPDATELYVSLSRGDIVQKTTRRTRFLAWIGAIPHWIYPVQLRRHDTAWRMVIVALSALGAVVSVTGLLHGVRVARVRRRSADGERITLAPFRDRWLRWHHLVGLSFGLFASTWVLSGMLSVVSFGAASSNSPSDVDMRAFRGGELSASSFTRRASEAITACADDAMDKVTRLDHVLVSRAPYYVCHLARGDTRVLRADAGGAPSAMVDREPLERAAHALGGGAAVESEEWLSEPDAYYYATHFEPHLVLPVLRTRFKSGLVTYVAPTTGKVERRFSRAARAHRWLYHGFHSLDLPALYRRPRAWHPLIVGLSAGGVLLSCTAAVVALRRWLRDRRRSSARQPRSPRRA
jgi:hypothetical protein